MKGNELPIPLCTHKGEEGLTYPTVHTFQAEHPTVAILQMRRAAYPTVYTPGQDWLTYPTVYTFEADPTVANLQMRRAAYPTMYIMAGNGGPIPLLPLLRLNIPL